MKVFTIIGTWLVGHVLVELSPIVALLVVLALRDPPRDAPKVNTLDLLLGDGILFFFSLVLSVGLFTDLLMDVLADSHRLKAYQFVRCLIAILIFTLASWTGYFSTQSRRSEGRATNFRASLLTTVVVVIFVGWIRWSFAIW